MSDSNLVSKVLVHVELEITVESSWDSECSIAQVQKEAANTALGKLQRVLTGDPFKSDRESIAVTITRIPTIIIRGYTSKG